ncbi:YeiH family protein [Ornithinimicrobium sufpigmenti]|uniref:YeiH family protein n=1 Tax=Ornithinimicrobium sufpigmenti TaxID=2508882 RepID=UPI0015E1B75A|nr:MULTISPECIES: putative sulfate exporter family transporter [unclassified Ornithinimicrobium]
MIRLLGHAWPALVAALVSVLVGRFVPTVSPLLWSMVLGIAVANSPLMPEHGLKGPQKAAKTLLRLGIVALGALLSWSALAALGLTGLLVIVVTVLSVFTLTCVIGDRLGLPRGLVTMTAAGFSICGAAAIAAVEGSIRRRDEDVALALAMVTIFGTVMTFVVPWLGGALGLGAEDVGIWVGASIHEVAQVVVAASLVGGAAGVALTAATTIKLGRVALLVLAYLGALRRESSRSEGSAREGSPRGDRSAVRLRDFVPWFLVGFVLMALARSVGLLPEAALDPITSLGTFLLAAGMFGLGLDIRVRRLFPLPPAVLGLSAASTGIALVVPLLLLLLL